MDIGAVLPVSLEGVKALSLNDAAREGRILEARVTAMVSATLARLAIEGQSLDVSTPRPLPVGTMLTVKAEHADGALRLITQGPVRAPETALPAAAQGQAMPGALLEPVKAVLAKVQALAFEASLAGTPAPAAAGTAPETRAPAPAAPQTGASAEAPRAASPMPLPGFPPSAASPAAPPTATPPTGASAQAARTASPKPPPSIPPGAASSAALAASMPQASASLVLPAADDAAAQAPAQPVSPASAQQAEAQARPSSSASAAAANRSAQELGLVLASFGEKRETAHLAPILAERAFIAAIAPDEAAAFAAPATVSREEARSPAAAGLTQQAPGQRAAATPAEMQALAPGQAAPEAREARPGGMALSDALAAYAAPDTTASQARAERAASTVIQLPLHFPGNPMPLRLEVEHDEGEPEPEAGEAPRAPSWTIRFAAEAGALGMVHAAITYASERIGVRLWAERGETAALFNQSAVQLQDALQASDLRLETLAIAEGRPAERRAAAGEPEPVERLL